MRRRWLLLLALTAAASAPGGCRGSGPEKRGSLDPGGGPPAGSTTAGSGASSAPARTPWPEFPRDEDQARALIEATRRRPAAIPERPARSAEQLAELIRRRISEGRAAAGWPAILAELARALDGAAASNRGAYLLCGSHHDSAAQIAAFRRIIGPGGPGGWTDIRVEQLHADGRWREIPHRQQRGDTLALERFLAKGGPQAAEPLIAEVFAHNYAAWKYRATQQLVDLLLGARALGLPLRGCDMPSALQARIAGLGLPLRMRLREIHCARALRDAPRAAGPARVAMFWGLAHVEAGGFPRLIEPRDEVVVVRLMGGRPGAAGPERALGRRIRLTHPLLIPLDPAGAERLLLLAEGWLAARLSRARDRAAGAVPAAGRHVVEVSLDAPAGPPGELVLGGGILPIKGQVRRQLPPGDHPYLVGSGGIQVAGRIRIPPGGGARLELARDHAVRILLREPRKHRLREPGEHRP